MTSRTVGLLSSETLRLKRLPAPELKRRDESTADIAKGGFSSGRIIFWISAISVNIKPMPRNAKYKRVKNRLPAEDFSSGLFRLSAGTTTRTKPSNVTYKNMTGSRYPSSMK